MLKFTAGFVVGTVTTAVASYAFAVYTIRHNRKLMDDAIASCER